MDGSIQLSELAEGWEHPKSLEKLAKESRHVKTMKTFGQKTSFFEVSLHSSEDRSIFGGRLLGHLAATELVRPPGCLGVAGIWCSMQWKYCVRCTARIGYCKS